MRKQTYTTGKIIAIGAILVTLAIAYILNTDDKSGRFYRWLILSLLVTPFSIFGVYQIEKASFENGFKSFLSSVSFYEALLIPSGLFAIFYLKAYIFGG